MTFTMFLASCIVTLSTQCYTVEKPGFKTRDLCEIALMNAEFYYSEGGRNSGYHLATSGICLPRRVPA